MAQCRGDRHATTTIASATKDIALNKLKPSPANVRRTGTEVGLEEFATSIAAHGLLQPLVVEPERNGEGEETAGISLPPASGGGALRILAKQKRIKRNEPIPCLIRVDGIATEISLAENVIRTSMHPADQFEAFQKLIDDGLGIEEIAARFSVTPAVVKQRLKLAAVSPRSCRATATASSRSTSSWPSRSPTITGDRRSGSSSHGTRARR